MQTLRSDAGQADLGAGSQTGTRDNAHPAAGRLDSDALRGEPDVPVSQSLTKPLRVEARAVVLDDEQDVVADRT